MRELRKRSFSTTVTVYELSPEIPEIEITKTRVGKRVTAQTVKYTGVIPKQLKNCGPAFMKEGTREKLLTTNPWWDIKNKFLINSGFETGKQINSNAKPEDLVWIYGSGHMLFDKDFRPIATPQMYDYIGTPFTNKTSHLKKLLAYLKEHPWVVNRDELEIVDVPYYNNESGMEQYISSPGFNGVVILPPADIWGGIYDLSCASKKEFFSTEMKDLLANKSFITKEHDFLGIRQFLRTEKPKWDRY